MNARRPRRKRSTIVIPALDIWRAAQLMVKRYGDDAAIQAGMRADEVHQGGSATVDAPDVAPCIHVSSGRGRPAQNARAGARRGGWFEADRVLQRRPRRKKRRNGLPISRTIFDRRSRGFLS